MSKNVKKIVLVLNVVYFLSIALVCSGIVLAGGVNCFKVFLSWVFFAFGIIIMLAKVSPSCTTLSALFRKRRVHHEA